MRQIRFKAKRLDGKGWIEGTPICINGKPYGIMIGEKESPDIDPSTICQFTGLKDCKGKEIWEGDIVERDIYVPYRGFVKAKAVIEYSVGAFVAMVNIAPYPLYSQDIKVVGNKFDKEK